MQTRFSLTAAAILLLAISCLALPALALDFPALSGSVVDTAGLLNAVEERRLTEQLARHESETSNQVVVVTLPSLQGTTIEDFGYQLGRHWGIGQEGRDNGVLLIVAPDERKVRIEVGYGLEGDLPDAIAKAIIEQEILPAFRSGDYPRGIAVGVNSVLAAIAGSYEPMEEEGLSDATWKLIITVVILIITIVISYYYSDDFGGYGDSRWPRRSRDNSNSSGFGGFGGGGFGGGGGGFSGGGGGFGGGGSSGSW